LIPAIQMMWTTRKTPDSCFLEWPLWLTWIR
jgi:hypothetical protein